MDLVSLVEELKRQKLNSFDIIAEDEHIYAILDESFGLVLGVYKTGEMASNRMGSLTTCRKDRHSKEVL